VGFHEPYILRHPEPDLAVGLHPVASGRARPLVLTGRSCYGLIVALPPPGSWTASPVLLTTLAGVGAVLPLRALLARRSRTSIGRGRIAALGGATVLLAAVTVTPIATLSAHYSLTAHLVQVTVVMGFVPPLLLIGLGDRLRLPSGRITGRAGRVLVHPATAIVLVNVVFFGWHATALYETCLEHEELYALQVVTLLLVSVVFWWPIVDPLHRAVLSPFFKLGYILLATIPQTFAGLTFALATHPFYSAYAAARPVIGSGALPDQQIAGACMALLSKIALFAAFSVVLLRMLGEGGEADDATGDDGGHGRGRDDDDAPLPVQPSMPAWLGLLETGPIVDEPAPPRERVGAR
jgi:cytochrome c oxidase assembly factor CtaG